MRVAVIGTGYVGLVSGACLADVGHRVTFVDAVSEKIEHLRRGKLSIFEPGLEELFVRNTEAGRLSFTTSYGQALSGADIVFVAVGTPSADDGSVDMSAFDAAVLSIAEALSGYAVVANKSTVPVGTAERAEGMIRSAYGGDFNVVSNPEFLREGHAVFDFLHPARIIVGSASARATDMMLRLYASLDGKKLVMDRRSAELTKYAANAFLAAKINFINEISHLAESVGADIDEVAKGIGSDPRIGNDFLRPGPGWGGSCFPKDVRALIRLADRHGEALPITRAAYAMNARARVRIIDRLDRAIGGCSGKRVAVFGLAFKGNTNDTRESASIDLINHLLQRGAEVRAYDPVARLPSGVLHNGYELVHAGSVYEAAEGADACILATDWEEFRAMNLPELASCMSGNCLFDARNLLDSAEAMRSGLMYLCIGKPSRHSLF